MPNPEKVRTLSIRLLRDEFTVDQALKEEYAPGGRRNRLRRSDWPAIEGAELFIGQIFTSRPSWISFLEEQAGAQPVELIASGAGAVLFLPVDDRIFALCLGHIHLALDEEAFERQFGLKVTLNSVPRNGLRTLDLATPDAVTFQKRVQASKDSDVQDFGVDVLRDLARVAGGTPSDLNFAKFVAGRDSLSITCKLSSDNLLIKCQQILQAYLTNTYKQCFPWIDNMQVVRDKVTVASLERKLFSALTALRAGQDSELHMAPPEIVDYEEGCLLHYNGFGSSGANFHSLSIEDYVAELNRCDFQGTIDDIRERHYIRAKAPDSEVFKEQWRVHRCFTYETNLNTNGVNHSYVLFSGDWYCVERNFKRQVEQRFQAIPRVTIVGPTHCRNERELIAHLEGNRVDLLCLDQVKINPQGVRYANIEPCDFLSIEKQFIHLKDGHSSGPISHLWAQGVVSAEALVSDADFRKKLRAVVSARRRAALALLPAINGRVVRAEYTVVYGIMRKPYRDGSLDLPFFSKVSLQAAVDRIDQLDIPVALEIIEKPANEHDAYLADEGEGGEVDEANALAHEEEE
ncbi:sporadically distributed protein, TIGR04141 family [Pseudomonas donghuensis]|nr:sporadically distributed protein, TIGR04141 family [Pseudomonas donghuensis]